MIDLHKKGQSDPPQKEIDFIINILNLNKLDEAKQKVEKLLIKYNNSSILYNILGAAYAGEKNLEESIKNYRKAISINNNYAQAYNNLGVALQKTNKINEAIENYNKAITLKNNFAEAYNNLGNAVKENYKFKEALVYFDKAIKIKPDYAEAYFNIASTKEILKNKDEAVNYYNQAISIRPNFIEAYNELGNILSELSRFDESLSCYKKAIKINPEYEKTYNNLGNLLSDLGNHDEATKAYNQAIKIKPNYTKAYSNLLMNFNYKLDLDTELYLDEAKKFGLNCKYIKKSLPIKYKCKKKPEKLKLGLVSADFGNHPGGFFSLSTLRELNKKNFDLFGYPTIDRNDEFSLHFKPLFKKWSPISKKKDEDVAKEIFDDGIHILMDLQGHSADNRLPLFFYKAAPIQISWLSQGTLGIPEIDYLIGSPLLTPPKEEKHFMEKILRLPEITQCFTPPDFEVKINTLPAIKNKYITFGCTNKLTKINDDVIALWSKILSSLKNAKIILKNKAFDNETTVKNTLARFKKNNIEENRIIMKGESKNRKELLKTYNEIDISLDPYPFQGNTSTCESVWMGVPVIVLKGNRFMFHFGESINSNLNMSDWIAKDREDYVYKALKFSSDINSLSKLRYELREKALKTPVFDAPRFTKHLSKGLWDVWNKYENDE